MRSRDILFMVCTFVASVVVLAVVHYFGDPTWVALKLPASAGGDAVMWQVQTTFLSVGFAGLTIAAQLFAEAPLAIGASRERVLHYIRAGWFVFLGLIANAAIAVETVWLPSDLGVLGVALPWFTATVTMLIISTARLMRLFSHPSRLDEVVRSSLVEILSSRLRSVSQQYASAKSQLEGLAAPDWPATFSNASSFTLRVSVPEAGRIIKTIRPKAVRQAMDSLGPSTTDTNLTDGDFTEQYEPALLTIDVEPGDRTRLAETAFRVLTPKPLDEATSGRIVRLLQSSLEFESVDSVTPDEETGREIANLRDAIGTNLRSGALATAERALELLGHVVRGVWMTGSANLGSSRRASFTRRDWLFRSVSEVEQDALLSPRIAGMFVSAAMTRALEAPKTGSIEYVDECLRSFTRLWLDVLAHGGSGFDSVPSQIGTCVQNLAAYAYTSADDCGDFQPRATWAMVELAKLALDAKKPHAAKLAVEELDGLFQFDRDGSGRAHVRGGKLVLAGWLDYLTGQKDERDPGDSDLRALVTPRGTSAEILAARSFAERDRTPFSQWYWWETKATPSGRAQALQLSGYIDRAQLSALAQSHGRLPQAEDQETASEYKRFLRLLEEGERELTSTESRLKERLTERVAEWDDAEDERLALEPLSADRLEELRASLRDTLNERPRLATEVPIFENVPEDADISRPILGMNFRVPRHYLVSEVFNQTYADPKELGRIIGRGFAEGEDRKILDELRALQNILRKPTARSMRQEIEALGAEAEHYVLLTPYGGLEDIQEWYSVEFRETLNRVEHIEIGELDTEAILFDRRSTLECCRKPEDKQGLAPVERTTIALGVFEDVQGGDEPQVRVETGEYFVVWPGKDPRVVRFGTETALGEANSSSPD